MTPSANTIYAAIELSNTLWLVGTRLPRAGKPRMHCLAAGNVTGLLALLADLRARATAKLNQAVDVACCFEAGRDGFWLHRVLRANGVEPASILVNRRAKRAKTDRLDAEGLLRVRAAHLGGNRQMCSMVCVPSAEEEDAKRPHREREHLVREPTRYENRILALLATQGIRSRPSLRTWDRNLAALRTGDGRPFPALLSHAIDRLRRRLVLTMDLIRELGAERAAALAASPDDAVCQKITALCRIRGVGENFAAMLVREVLYRPFANRKQLASYIGLTPTPYQSGSIDRDRRIRRAGNTRARTTLVQLAWL